MLNRNIKKVTNQCGLDGCHLFIKKGETFCKHHQTIMSRIKFKMNKFFKK